MRYRAVLPGLTLSLTLALTAGCAAGPGPGGPTPGEAADLPSVPGFDTRDYPGDEAMRSWLEASPYRWVGYYLPAPCYTGTSWVGKRQALEAMGWGLAVLYVGEQDWAAQATSGDRPVSQPAPTADVTGPRCTRDNLSADQGAADAADATERAAAQGFPDSTYIYLDIERVDEISLALEDYVREWTRGLLEKERYLPALYAHARNAGVLYSIMEREVAEVAAERRDTAEDEGDLGIIASPRLWVAKSDGFDLERPPQASGYPQADAWQGAFDVSESHGGVELRIDRNVAATAAPSKPAPRTPTQRRR